LYNRAAEDNGLVAEAGRSARTWPFLAGIAVGAAAAAWANAGRRRRLDARILRALPRSTDPPPAVFVPGIMGTQLLRPDGSEAWLNLGNTLGHHDLSLPRRLPFSRCRDDLHPGFLVGTDNILPRAFGFSEYADVLDLLDRVGYEPGTGKGLRYAVYAYDWRRDLVETARGLGMRLDGLALEMGDPDARFHVVGHSMGGLVARYYLRYGGAEPVPNAPVTWAGARRLASVVLAATPNAGSIHALGAVLGGERVGFSYTTLAASVVSRMPSIYQILPTAGTEPLVDARGHVLGHDLHDPETWERFRWGPFAPSPEDRRAEKAFLLAALKRARAFHDALACAPQTPCPVPVYAIGGDCLLTLARAVVDESRPGTPPRLEARTRREQDLLYEAGDGRVTRASLLASHLPGAEGSPSGSGAAEIAQSFFGAADHHGLYSDPALQSLLVRLLLRPRPSLRVRTGAAEPKPALPS
jgi:pimeloyl-ACP methyl ester carboxylesterase